MKTLKCISQFTMVAILILGIYSCDKESTAIAPEFSKRQATSIEALNQGGVEQESIKSFRSRADVLFNVEVLEDAEGDNSGADMQLTGNGSGWVVDYGMCRVGVDLLVNSRTGKTDGHIIFNFSNGSTPVTWYLDGFLTVEKDASHSTLLAKVVPPLSKKFSNNNPSGRGDAYLFGDIYRMLLEQAPFQSVIVLNGNLIM